MARRMPRLLRSRTTSSSAFTQYHILPYVFEIEVREGTVSAGVSRLQGVKKQQEACT